MLSKTRNIAVCLGLLIVSTHLFSQQTKVAPKSADSIKHSILLIPVKPTMIMSEIGKAVNTTTKLSYPKIAQAFRYSLDLALYNTLKQTYNVKSLIQTKKKSDSTLLYIYNSIGYNYDIIPGHDSGESHSEFDPKQQKTHFIKNGQLQVPMDYTKRFMNTYVVNPKLLPKLNSVFGSDIIVFINELDIRNVANTLTEDLTASNFRREIMVQYTILNAQKQYLAKGVLTTYFPHNMNDPKIIGEKYFAIIAADMSKELAKGLAKAQAFKDKPGAIHSPKKVTKKK